MHNILTDFRCIIPKTEIHNYFSITDIFVLSTVRNPDLLKLTEKKNFLAFFQILVVY